MTGPLARYIAEPDTPLYRWYREIDNHYHLQTIAQDQRQILEFHRQVYQVNMIRAVGTLRQIRDGQRLGNQTLGGIFDELAHLGASISAHLAHLDARLEDLPNILSAVEGLGTKFDYMGGVVAAGLELIAEEMFAARSLSE